MHSLRSTNVYWPHLQLTGKEEKIIPLSGQIQQPRINVFFFFTSSRNNNNVFTDGGKNNRQTHELSVTSLFSPLKLVSLLVCSLIK